MNQAEGSESSYFYCSGLEQALTMRASLETVPNPI